MTEEFEPGRRESVLTAVLVYPLRAVERTRGWRRLGLLALYAVIALLVCGLLWRRSQLRELPDVGPPFDVAAFRSPPAVPDERNAFVLYRKAADRFRYMNPDESGSFKKANLRWSHADARLRAWVAEHAEAVALLRAGSERPEAAYGATEAPTVQGAHSEKSQVINRLSWIGDAALFEAGRLRSEGDPAGAWALLKAVVRASRHMAQALPTVWGRTTAMTLVHYARVPVAEWARDPAVDVALLRRALNDLAAAEALTPTLAAGYRENYLLAEESLADLKPLLVQWSLRRSEAAPFDPSLHAPGLAAYFRGEPERSRRVLRLLFANDLAWCDRPLSERPAFADSRLQIYEPDPSAPPASRALPPAELARWADSSLVAPVLPSRLADLERWDYNDRWSLRSLKDPVAVALFTREVGRPPTSPAAALRRYLPSPDDPPDHDESEPIPPPQPGPVGTRP